MSENMFFSRISDGWIAEPPGFAVTRCLVDFAFSIEIMHVNHEIAVRIGGNFVLTVGDVSKIFDPEETMTLGEALIVFNKSLLQMTVYDSGVIQMRFSDGISIEVQPDDDYEAWELNTTQHEMIVCLPGGGLALWGIG